MVFSPFAFNFNLLSILIFIIDYKPSDFSTAEITMACLFSALSTTLTFSDKKRAIMEQLISQQVASIRNIIP